MKLNEIKPLFEGGNIFKDENKKPVTIRINKADVDPTLKWLEKIVKLPLIDNKLGSTGIRSTSGDLDIAVDQSKISKDEVRDRLAAWAEKKGHDPRDWVRKSGISVHFKTPIRGEEKNGFVQSDLMFGDPDWMKFSLQGSGDDTPFKGVHRQLLMASIAKANGLKWSSAAGLTSRESGDLISKDPDRIAEVLLGKGNTGKDLSNVESIIKAIKDHPEYEELVKDAKEAFARDDLKLPSHVNETFSDSKLRNFPGGNRHRSGSDSSDLEKIKQIISDEDYDEMFRTYGPMFVDSDARKRYPRDVALSILKYLKGVN